MPSELLTAIGRLTITLRGPDGAIKDQRTVDNLVTTAGKNLLASRLGADSPAGITHMAIGTSSSTAAVGNTTLGAEAGRVSVASAVVSGSANTITATFPAGTGTGAITEAGLLNAGTLGTLFSRSVFSVVTKGASDALTIDWTVTVG